jgi:hypothetical protein
LEDTATVWLARAACGNTLMGKAAAGSTQRRKRSVFYYAALRSSEAVMLRETDLHLPRKGWGRMDLAASPPTPARPEPTTAPPARNAG